MDKSKERGQIFHDLGYKQIKELLDLFYDYTKIGVGLLDKNGHVVLESNGDKSRNNGIYNVDFKDVTMGLKNGERYYIKKFKNGFTRIYSPIKIEGFILGFLYIGDFIASEITDECAIYQDCVEVTNDTHIMDISQGKTIMDMLLRYSKPLFLMIIKNINSIRKKNRVEEVHKRYKMALEASNNIIFDTNIDKQFVSISKEILGLQDSKITFKALEFLCERLVYPSDIKRIKNDFYNITMGKSDTYKGEYRILENDTYKWKLFRGKLIRSKGKKPSRVIGTITDITEIKEYEKEIQYLAYYDSLTNLPNMNLFLIGLKEAVSSNNKGAVFYIDIDNFKSVNHTLGYQNADKLLKQLSERLKSCCNNKHLISRFGGDEFLILLRDIENENEALDIANSICKIPKHHFTINEKQIFISVSIGIAFFNDKNKDTSTILRNADTALNYAKQTGKGKFKIFDENLYKAAIRRAELELDLRKGILENQFEVYYQPQFDIKSQKITGFEALLRWNHPTEGVVYPMEFIPIAEDTGLIIQLGEWVLKSALKQFKEWEKHGMEFKSIAVNISGVQIQQHDFLNKVKEIIKGSGVNPGSIELEVTENIMLDNVDATSDKLQILREMGLKIALDDFGTGYSSLNYLMDLPINTIKIDKVFIDGITKDYYGTVTNSIINLSKALKLKVTAEGVETNEELMFLRDRGCDKIQGYFIAKPMPGNMVVDFVSNFDKQGQSITKCIKDSYISV